MECISYSSEDYTNIQEFFEIVISTRGFKYEPNGRHNDLINIEGDLSKKGGGFWILKADGKIIGTNALKMLDEENKIGEVKRLYVLPEEQGNGYGKLLLYFGIQYARSNGFKVLRLDTLKKSEKAIALYKKAGFYQIDHPPVLGGKVKSVDDSATLKVKGVKKTVPIDPFTPPHAFQPLGGVAVIADNTWSAFKGRDKLKIDWDNGANASYTSTEFKKQLQETARKPGKVVHTTGDPDAEFAKGGKIIEAEYYAPHLAHASMEPPVAVADVQGDKVTVWSPTQNPVGVREQVAHALGLKKEDIVCHVTFLGGGFGRKSKPDYAVEAAVLSKKTGKPVKVVWSREDDIKFDYYHSVAAMYLKAALDDSGKPKAWLQRSVFPPIGSTFNQNEVYGGAGEMGMGWNVLPFDLPNFRSENGQAVAHVRIGWLRSVANIYHAFGVQSFVNELAYAANRDPYDYLIALIGSNRAIEAGTVGPPELVQKYPYETGRLRHVAELAAAKANWGKKKPGNGWGMGIAVHRSFLTYVATVVEVEVDNSGSVRIPNVYTAVDAGIVANPDMLRSQFQGAAVFGTSLARTGEITATNGAIDQSNYHDYPVARMNDAPLHVDVQIVESTAPPAGVGEPGVPPFAPALCNAIYAATGKRVRELPLTRNGFA